MLSSRCLESPIEFKAGCSPMGLMSGSRVACRISLEASKMAQCRLQPQQSMALDTFMFDKSVSHVAVMKGEIPAKRSGLSSKTWLGTTGLVLMISWCT